MKIAVCQEKGAQGDKPTAMAAMRAKAREAAAQGAGLVIFPELFLTGYHIGEEVFRLAEAADGPSADAVAAIARDAGIAILYGYPERSGGRVFNSARLVNASGERAADYRKTHLYGREEKRLFTPGDALVAADLGGLKIGILICYDVEFPEAVRSLAAAGAELIALPTAPIQPYAIVARTLIPARAFENQVYVAHAGLCGTEGGLGYSGLSCIVGPDGRDIARAGADPCLLFAEIDASVVSRGRRDNPYLSERRSEIYAAPVKTAGPPSPP